MSKRCRTLELPWPLMNSIKILTAAASVLAITLGVTTRSPSADAVAAANKPPLLDALVEELERSTANLKAKGDEPLYYLSYRVNDERSVAISASYGALTSGLSEDDAESGRVRLLDVSARVGSRKLDNTHKVRGEWNFGFSGFGGTARLPIEDDPAAIKVVLWRATDRAYKAAVKQLMKVKTNKAVKVEEEDKADDFSDEKPQVQQGEAQAYKFEKEAWKGRLKRLSGLFKAHPYVLSSSVSLQGHMGSVYFVDSDGARIHEPRFFARLMIDGSVKAEDGMDLELYHSFEATTIEQLPTEEEAARALGELIARLEALRTAPVVEPYSGPAIIMNRAAAVYFHEIFGHRIEGHRQKDEDEGQTFTKKLNQLVMPEFITVKDDPTQKQFGSTILNGHYLFDEEGVPAQKVTLVEKGILKAFLMGRSPIKNFPQSNGHGRAEAGEQPCARQGNLVVESSNRIPFSDLRARLIEEVKKKGKPYGLMFQDISGGFTSTGRDSPQAFKVIPLIVFRVYPDGRPDELVRGVDLVGTPLTSLEKILVTGDDDAVFNGFCGAESGFVPVAAVAPSLLVAEMEGEKKEKADDRPPLLPPPLHATIQWKALSAIAEEGTKKDGLKPPAAPKSGPLPLKPAPAEPKLEPAPLKDGQEGTAPNAAETDVVFKALEDEIARAKTLSVEKLDKPYWLSAFANDSDSFQVSATFGALTGKGGGRNRSTLVSVRVGDKDLDNTNFGGGGGFFRFSRFRGGSGAPDEADYDALRQVLWLQFDAAYKKACETISKKRAFLETNNVKDRPPDFGSAPATELVLPREELKVDKEKWTQIVKDVSAAFRQHEQVYQGSAAMWASCNHQYLVTTDPVKHRFAEPYASFSIAAETQAQDGMQLSASWGEEGRTEKDLPSGSSLVEIAHKLAARIEALAKAPHSEDYSGPVLFTERAAASFFLTTIGDPLSGPRPPLGAPKESRLIDRLGSRIASSLLTVRDDPTVKEWNGKPLLGYYPIDDDSVKPMPITLIDGGVLKTCYMSRVPIENVKETNGHSRAGRGSVGNLFVEAKETKSRDILKKQLIELAAEEDLEYGLLVEELGGAGMSFEGLDFDDFESESFFAGRGSGRGGSISPGAPSVMYRIHKDGREELVRGGSFKPTTYRILKDIVALGDDVTVVNTSQFGQHISVLSPSVLVKNIELKKSNEDFKKPPFTPRPAFPDKPSVRGSDQKKDP